MTQEQIVDNIILNEIELKNPGFKDLVLPKTTKESRRTAILSILDDDRKLFERYKNIVKSEEVCGHYAEEIVQVLREYVHVADVEKKQFGEVMTPLTLVNEMLDKLPNEVWSNPNLKWLDPCNGVGTFPSVVIKRLMDGLKEIIIDDCERYRHIIEHMIYVCELQPKNMFLYHCAFDREDDHELNTYFGSFLDKGFNDHTINVWGIEKFDIVVGNPPYNKPGTSNSGNTIWPKFVELSLDLLSVNGFLVMVHPPSWRKPESKLFEVMKLKKIHHISIHNVEDGKKVFGAQTRYDWYVLQNQPTDNFVNIDCEDGNFTLNLEQYPFIPNKKMNEILSIVSNEDVCDVIYDRGSYPSEYIDTERGREWMSKNQDDIYQYPIINNINKKGTTCFYSSINNLGHFNISKVIITTSNSEMNVLDTEGRYGMSKHIFGIKIDNEQEGKMIIKALSTDKFKKLSEALIWGNYGIEWRVFKYIKKDFYKQFVDENGNEI